MTYHYYYGSTVLKRDARSVYFGLLIIAHDSAAASFHSSGHTVSATRGQFASTCVALAGLSRCGFTLRTGVPRYPMLTRSTFTLCNVQNA